MTDYYQKTEYLSNSALTALFKELDPIDQREYEEALRFGSLFDALLTEPHRIDFINNTCDGHAFDRDKLRQARSMFESLKKHFVYPAIIARSAYQVEFFDDVDFEWNGMAFTVASKCKYDGFLIRYGWDLKSTACKTLSDFLACIERFNYDRAATLYMKLSKTDKFIIIGVSKAKPYTVFVVTITRGDSLWVSGEEKLNEAAFRFWMLKCNV